MKQGKKIVAVVPARFGSERVRCKALRLLAGNPLMYYVLNTLTQCGSFDEIYVNSESDLIGEVAKRYGTRYYKRPPELATSASLIDEYIYEFLTNIPCDVLAIVNPTSPFLTAAEIDGAVDHFLGNNFDTQLACTTVRTHSFVDGVPVNFSTAGKHPRSQDIPPVQALNFAVTIWNAPSFMKQFCEKGYAVYTGRLGFYAFHGLSTIDIDWEEDFALADVLMANRDRLSHSPAVYDEVLEKHGAGAGER